MVFLTGAEDGIFPHSRALTEPDELEEERRLAYVGITRAKEQLFVTHAWSRNLFGSTQYNPPSRFLEEIPEELVDAQGNVTGRSGYGRQSLRPRADSGIRRGAGVPPARSRFQRHRPATRRRPSRTGRGGGDRRRPATRLRRARRSRGRTSRSATTSSTRRSAKASSSTCAGTARRPKPRSTSPAWARSISPLPSPRCASAGRATPPVVRGERPMGAHRSPRSGQSSRTGRSSRGRLQRVVVAVASGERHPFQPRPVRLDRCHRQVRRTLVDFGGIVDGGEDDALTVRGPEGSLRRGCRRARTRSPPGRQLPSARIVNTFDASSPAA